ncbi:MAG: DUF192 domain-containing protein [Desulfitobacteriaceae bacterium]
MQCVRLRNARTGRNIGESVWLADTYWTRLRGLLGRSVLNPGEGLWLQPCQQVHMLGMIYPLSIWFIDEYNKVFEIIDTLYPWEISSKYSNATSVLEFPVHWAEMTGTVVGDELLIL